MSSIIGTTRVVVVCLAVSSFGCDGDRAQDEMALPESVAEANGDGHAFTYSIIETASDPADTSALIQSSVVPMMVEAGAAPYSVWLPAEFPKDAPFAGLSDVQLSVMLAWPDDGVRVKDLDTALSALDEVGAVKTRTFDPIYLAEGLHVPTGRGFYVHREERYRVEDVAEAVRLSKEAWTTFEPTFGTRVTGLFRERLAPNADAQLLRIVWYGSFEAWSASREFERDPESRQRFLDRGRLQLEGSGVAIATDRAAP